MFKDYQILLGLVLIGLIITAISVLKSAGLIMSKDMTCLLYTSPSPRDKRQSRMPSSA